MLYQSSALFYRLVNTSSFKDITACHFLSRLANGSPHVNVSNVLKPPLHGFPPQYASAPGDPTERVAREGEGSGYPRSHLTGFRQGFS